MSKIDTVSSTPDRVRKYWPALAAGAVLAIAAFAGTREGGNSTDNSPKVETPVATTIVPAGSGGVWEAAKEELIISGYGDSEDRVSNQAVVDLMDESMELNKAANPNFESDKLQAREPIIIVDMPDK
jgi:hypothetical protein